MKIVHVVGARPNFMKVAPVLAAARAAGLGEQVLVHTGQHYDAAMSDVFFTDLGMPRPDIFLGVGSGTHAEQTARVMVAFEQTCREVGPDLVVVAGDVNSTMAAAIVAAKLVIPCAHVEAGLRSNDRTMPEEVNRIVTDRLCELLFTPSADGDENLLREGVPPHQIHRIGNAMIDSLLAHLPAARAFGVVAELGLRPREYVVLTLHRPANVDDDRVLTRLLGAVGEVAKRMPVVFPVHPRTRKSLERIGSPAGVRLCEPLGYLSFLGLTADAAFVMTDSGGLQEETTALGIPCLTLRENTERPVTVTEGTNTIVGSDPDRIAAEVERIFSGGGKRGRVPDLWDGRAGVRAAEAIASWARARR